MTALDGALQELVRQAVREVIREEVLPKLQAAAAPAGVFLTTAEAAELARVEPATIREWANARELPKHGTARHLLIRRDQLEHFLAGGDPHRLTDDEVKERVAAVRGKLQRAG